MLLVRQVHHLSDLIFHSGRAPPGDREGQTGCGRSSWHFQADCDEETSEGRVSPEDRDDSIIHLVDSDKPQPSGFNEMVARTTVG